MAKEQKTKRGRRTNSDGENKEKRQTQPPASIEILGKDMTLKRANSLVKKIAKARKALIIETITGARRERGVAGSKDTEFPAKFSLIPARGLQRLAITCGEGFLKYGQGNWLNGFKETELIDHVDAHMNEYKKGDKSEDHLAHAAWNIFTLMHIQETEEPGSELLDLIPQVPRSLYQAMNKKKKSKGPKNRKPKKQNP